MTQFTKDTPFVFEGVTIWRTKDGLIRYSHPRLDATVIACATHAFIEAERAEPTPSQVELPDIGRWIEATDANGVTKIIEVTVQDHYDSVTIINGDWDPAWNARIDDPETEDPSIADGRIVKWRYVDKPASVYKKGDTVPGYTKVNRPWLGEGMLSVAGVENSPYYTTDRRIEWIAREES